MQFVHTKVSIRNIAVSADFVFVSSAAKALSIYGFVMTSFTTGYEFIRLNVALIIKHILNTNEIRFRKKKPFCGN